MCVLYVYACLLTCALSHMHTHTHTIKHRIHDTLPLFYAPQVFAAEQSAVITQLPSMDDDAAPSYFEMASAGAVQFDPQALSSQVREITMCAFLLVLLFVFADKARM